MFFRSKSIAPEHASELDDLVAKCIPDADADTQKIVVAIAGLFGCISYADRDFAASERRIVQSLLQTIHGIDAASARHLVDGLAGSIVHVATVEAPRFARTLKQLGDRDLRLHVLDMLLDIAAADHELTQAEVVVLRQTTTTLGLEQSDYNVLQAKHRALLAALKGD